MMYQVPEHIDRNKIFIVRRSEIEGRLDPHYNMPVYCDLFNTLETLPFELSTLKQVSYAIFSGITPRSGGDAYSCEDDSVPFVRSGDYSETNMIDFSNLLYLKPEVHNTIMKGSQLKKYDLLIAIVGATIGKIGVYIYDKAANINQAICGIRLKEHISPFYIQAFYQTNIGQKIIERAKRPVARANLNLEEIGNLPIPIVNESLQQKVIKTLKYGINKKHQKESEAQQLLESIDTYILNELGITLPEIKTDLKSRIFLVNRNKLEGRFDPYYSQKHFVDAFSSLYLGKYRVFSLKSLSILITSGITPKSGGDAYTENKELGIPFVRSGNIDINGDLNFNELLYIKPEIHNTIMKSSQVKPNDLMIAIVGATIGQVGIYLDKREANINQAIALVRLKDGNDTHYIKEVIKSSIGQLSLNRLKRPVARANINLEEISTILVPLPPPVKQHKIASHIYTIRQRAKTLQEEGKAILENAKKEVEQMIIGK